MNDTPLLDWVPYVRTSATSRAAAERIARHVRPDDSGCLLWTRGRCSDGYGTIKIKGTMYRVHRLAWELANDRPIPDKMHVLHKCDVPACINPDHLFLGTHAENVADRVAKNRSARLRGEDSARAILTSSEVHFIRKTPLPASLLAKQYGVSKRHINRIRRREYWGHL